MLLHLSALIALMRGLGMSPPRCPSLPFAAVFALRLAEFGKQSDCSEQALECLIFFLGMHDLPGEARRLSRLKALWSSSSPNKSSRSSVVGDARGWAINQAFPSF